jgi:cyclase
MRRFITLGAIVAIGALSMAAAQAQQDVIGVKLVKLKENLYIITGGRQTPNEGGIAGNTTVFIADSGVVLVDTKYHGYGKTILDQVRSVTTKPVTMIVNTHTHADHTGSNTEFPQAIEFVVQENTKANMARMDGFKGTNAAFLPKRTFKDRLSLLSGKDRIDLYYFGRGHTDGDTVVHFPALRVVVMGDLFARKWAPLVDTTYGGSMTSFPQTLAKAAGQFKDADTIVTGHATTTHGSGPGTTFTRSNPTMKPADLQEYAEFTRAFVSAAEAAMKAGKSVADAAAILQLPEKFKDYDMANAKNDVQRVYDELRK